MERNPGRTPRALFPADGTVRRLGAEIAAAAGLPLGGPFRADAVAAVWGRASPLARALRLAGRRVLTVEPGPLVSPYDTPRTGFASLRLRLDGGAETVHYLDPWTRAPVTEAACAEAVAWLAARFSENERRVVTVGMSRWKRPTLDVFCASAAGPPVHTMTVEAAVAAARRHDAQVVAWATRAPAALEAACAAAGLPLARCEDGFLRSVGLGASLQPGASIVLDDRGIYYDPRRDSRLAALLRDSDFPPDLVARAARLRTAIVARRLSKYNVGRDADLADLDRARAEGRRIVLVPGQVEDDASVRTGSGAVRTNRALLEAARARHPDAMVLYKPHPDVEAGFRPGIVPAEEALRLADRLVPGVSIVDLLDRVHRVETMTSLTGFEALLRGLAVTTHGRPFYAGWGLTEDLAADADRGRVLSLDALVAGALILYPRYLDPVAMKPCTPEHLLDRLSAARAGAPRTALALGRLDHAAMRARYALSAPFVRALRGRRGVGEADGTRR